MQSFCRMGLVAMATVAFLAAADAPYMGKWKLNLAKSRLTGETLSIEKTPSGSMKYVTAEVSYDFKTDEREHPGGDCGAQNTRRRNHQGQFEVHPRIGRSRYRWQVEEHRGEGCSRKHGAGSQRFRWADPQGSGFRSRLRGEIRWQGLSAYRTPGAGQNHA